MKIADLGAAGGKRSEFPCLYVYNFLCNEQLSPHPPVAVYTVNGTYANGRQHMHSLCVYMICLNHDHRDELDRSILDLDSRQKGQISMLQSQKRTQHRLVVASSPGLLIGGRGKEGLVSTACACAVIIQILNNPITYGYRLYMFTDTFTVKYTENVAHVHAVDIRPSFPLPPPPNQKAWGRG